MILPAEGSSSKAGKGLEALSRAEGGPWGFLNPASTLEMRKLRPSEVVIFALCKITYSIEPRKEPSSSLILVQRLYYFTDALPNCMVITLGFFKIAIFFWEPSSMMKKRSPQLELNGEKMINNGNSSLCVFGAY